MNIYAVKIYSYNSKHTIKYEKYNNSTKKCIKYLTNEKQGVTIQIWK